MPRNIARINNYYNRIEAVKDWNKIAAQYPEIAKQFYPGLDAGWRKIDKAIAKVREAAALVEIGPDAELVADVALVD